MSLVRVFMRRCHILKLKITYPEVLVSSDIDPLRTDLTYNERMKTAQIIVVCTTAMINHVFLQQLNCNGTRVPYFVSSLSRLRDHSILRHYLRHYFRACASVSFSWFDHAVSALLARKGVLRGHD